MNKWLQMQKIVLFIILILSEVLFFGCVMFTVPPDNKGFYDIASLYDLEGQYSNEGEAGSGILGNPLLSRLIWGSNSTLDHDQISTIEVNTLNAKTLLVNAYIQNDICKSATFVKGVDFKFDIGKITLVREAGGYKEGGVIVGPYYENIEIGIDKRGNGKYRLKYSVAGLAYLVVPVAAGGRDDFRFKRLDKVKR